MFWHFRTMAVTKSDSFSQITVFGKNTKLCKTSLSPSLETQLHSPHELFSPSFYNWVRKKIWAISKVVTREVNVVEQKTHFNLKKVAWHLFQVCLSLYPSFTTDFHRLTRFRFIGRIKSYRQNLINTKFIAKHEGLTRTKYAM